MACGEIPYQLRYVVEYKNFLKVQVHSPTTLLLNIRNLLLVLKDQPIGQAPKMSVSCVAYNSSAWNPAIPHRAQYKIEDRTFAPRVYLDAEIDYRIPTITLQNPMMNPRELKIVTLQ